MSKYIDNNCDKLSQNKKFRPTLNVGHFAFTDLTAQTGNIYETVNIISKRAKYLGVKSKAELDQLLEEFGKPSSASDTSHIDECSTICRSFDSQPKAHLKAISEYLSGNLYLKKIED